jgi:AICAR transformylase/IMP cyclohydrolase PurH
MNWEVFDVSPETSSIEVVKHAKPAGVTLGRFLRSAFASMLASSEVC